MSTHQVQVPGDRETTPMFDLTVGLARFADQSPAEAAMFEAIATSQHEADGFIAVLSGVMPPGRFFAPPHLIKLVGVRRFVQLARSRPRAAEMAQARSSSNSSS